MRDDIEKILKSHGLESTENLCVSLESLFSDSLLVQTERIKADAKVLLQSVKTLKKQNESLKGQVSKLISDNEENLKYKSQVEAYKKNLNRLNTLKAQSDLKYAESESTKSSLQRKCENLKQEKLGLENKLEQTKLDMESYKSKVQLAFKDKPKQPDTKSEVKALETENYTQRNTISKLSVDNETLKQRIKHIEDQLETTKQLHLNSHSEAQELQKKLSDLTRAKLKFEALESENLALNVELSRTTSSLNSQIVTLKEEVLRKDLALQNKEKELSQLQARPKVVNGEKAANQSKNEVLTRLRHDFEVEKSNLMTRIKLLEAKKVTPPKTETDSEKEYLKNILVNLITANKANEKRPLLAVLRTMFKFDDVQNKKLDESLSKSWFY